MESQNVTNITIWTTDSEMIKNHPVIVRISHEQYIYIYCKFRIRLFYFIRKTVWLEKESLDADRDVDEIQLTGRILICRHLHGYLQIHFDIYKYVCHTHTIE